MFALTPLILFSVIYLLTSLLINDFYKIPITVAFLISSIYAVATTKGSLSKRIEVFSRGAGNKSMMLMLWIFILAGAFAETASAMGAVDATVNSALYILPKSMILPGVFLASCFISLAIGTSVGTIAALTPIAVGLAAQTSTPLPLMVAIVVGGSYFGDNLSFISDTTIVATQTQECKMSDKFKVNSRIVVPAAIVVMIIYLVIGINSSAEIEVNDFKAYKIIPYILVIAAAVFGLNVLIVLVLGIILSSTIGLIDGSFDIFECLNAMSRGMIKMSELIIMTLLAAGMLAIIKQNGGIDYIISKLTKGVSGKRSAEYSIALLVILVNICTANNTVAIITTGPIARDIADKYSVDRRKSASILDTCSCFTQGILPYGAQMIMAAGMAGISAISVISNLYYNMAIIVAVALAIAFRYPRKYSI